MMWIRLSHRTKTSPLNIMNQAVVSDDLAMVIALEKEGITVSNYDIHCAGRSGCMNVIAYFHSAGYDLKCALIGACCSDFKNKVSRNSKDTVTWLLDHGVTPSSEALEQAVLSRDRELFDFLVSSGANWADEDVFACACIVDDDYFVRTLVSMGANINSSCSIDGGNGLNSASATGNFKILEYLKTLGLQSIPDNYGKYPEDYAITA